MLTIIVRDIHHLLIDLSALQQRCIHQAAPPPIRSISTGVDLTGLQVGDPVILDARGYLSFFVFYLFLEFKDEFRRDFLNTIPPDYNAPF